MNDAARLIIASGGQCCANCLYAEVPTNPNPFRPAVVCLWLGRFPRLPVPMSDDGYYFKQWSVEMPPETQGCPAWEQKGQ